MPKSRSIVGIWSADAIYGPGAQSDTVLVFLPDGTGVLEEWNFVLCYYDLFTWKIGDNDTLSITGIKSVTENESRQVVDEPSQFGEEQFLFSVADEDTPKGEVAEVLTLICTSTEKSSCTDRYGRFEGRYSQDGSDYQLPTFYHH